MKIVIFNSHGPSGFPEHILKQIQETNFPQSRCGSVIDILENIPKQDTGTCPVAFRNRLENLKSDEVLRLGNKFIFGNECRSHNNITCEIVEVDVNKKWTIDMYDGAEHIEYIDNYVCISGKLNYWEKP